MYRPNDIDEEYDEIIVDENVPSMQVQMAALILDRIHNRDEDIGAVFTEATGMPGSAKSAVDLSFAEDTCLNYPKEKVFWRSIYNAPLQFLKLPRNKWHIMRQEESKVDFIDLSTGQTLDIGYTPFTNFDDLYQKAKPGKVNAVFFQQTGFWRDFIHWQLDGTGIDWVTNILDDYGDLCPAFSSGNEWKEVENFTQTLKDVRKCRVNVHSNTQSVTDIYYKVRTKIIISIYMFGAKASRKGRVSQRAIDNLRMDHVRGNQAWIEYGGSIFGKTRFPKIYKPNPDYQWSARRTGKYRSR